MAPPKQTLTDAYDATSSFVSSVAKRDRKKYGQFFTSPKTAEYMASLFDIDHNKSELTLLDAGAGTGLLTVALVEHLRLNGYSRKIKVVCYENDEKVLPTLSDNLNRLSEMRGIAYEIRTENYITSQNFIRTNLYKKEAEKFDMIIGNPPYLKIAKDAPEALDMAEVCYGAPNMYFLFWAMGINNLKEDSELVYIVPRSWTSGAYFERFRRYLFNHCVITHIHIFGSRDKVFDGESVLQETMIIKVRKSRSKPKFIQISTSETSNFSNVKHYKVNYDVIVAPNQFVLLVTNQNEADILSRINRQTSTLELENLKMRTGIIVDFRARDVLRDVAEKGSYPLFYSCHIKDGQVIWPCGSETQYIVTDRKSYLQENSDYLFVKRFTSKEEKRRLQCGIYLKSDYNEYKYISTQNKINYIKCDTPEVAYGLYTLLNSSLYDSYYRILDGSTQVNSTEINQMPIPSRDTIRIMGRELMGQELTEHNCNKIIDKWIK